MVVKRLLDWMRANKTLCAIFGIYLVVGLLLVTWYRYPLNPDGISYLTIAQKYASGNFREAINGYWGPLLSWLLVPFVWLDLSLQTASRLVGLFAGFGALVFTWLIMKNWGIKHEIRLGMLSLMVPLVWYWSQAFGITPDLLIVAAMMTYIYLLSRKQSFGNAALVGLAGAAGYMVKSYFLFFVTVHLITLFAITYLTVSKKPSSKQIKYYGVCLVALLIFIAPWVIAISIKYDRLTVSTAGSYNFSLLNPDQPGHPMNYAGLMDLPNATAVSAWEDPTYIKQAAWNPLESLSNLRGYVRTVFDNIRRTGIAFIEFSVFSLAAIALFVLLTLQKGVKKRDDKRWLLLSATIVYLFGYWLILIEPRYMWPLFLMLVLLAGLQVDQAKLSKYSNEIVTLALFITFMSVLYTPVTHLYYKRNPTATLRYQAELLKPYIKPGEHIASDNFSAIGLCYYLRAKCFGALSTNRAKAQEELEAYDITAIILMNQATEEYTFLKNFEPIDLVDPTIHLLKQRSN